MERLTPVEIKGQKIEIYKQQHGSVAGRDQRTYYVAVTPNNTIIQSKKGSFSSPNPQPTKESFVSAMRMYLRQEDKHFFDDHRYVRFLQERGQGVSSASSDVEEAPDNYQDLLNEDYQKNVYRIWLNESSPAGGDRREIARYKAVGMEDVIDAVKEEQLDEVPNNLDRQYMGEGKVGLMWTEEPPQDVLRDQYKDYKQAKKDVDEKPVSFEQWKRMEREIGQIDTTYTIEIEEDNSATFPMNLVTGGTAGRDLTGE